MIRWRAGHDGGGGGIGQCEEPRGRGIAIGMRYSLILADS